MKSLGKTRNSLRELRVFPRDDRVFAMNIKAVKLDIVMPPQDDLLSKIRKSKLSLKEGDIVAVSSKVVSIWEGRTIPMLEVTKDELVKKEADLWLPREKKDRCVMHTITKNFLIASAGIDESNGDGYYVLWPKNPVLSAQKVLKWLKKEYKIRKLGVVVTDSHSVPLRRGVTGFALSYAGFDPLYDYRGKEDIFGREMKFSMTNVADSLAASAVLAMGEGNEKTPLAVISGAPYIRFGKAKNKKKFSSFEVPLEEDLFGVFLRRLGGKKGGSPK
ncbi:MAG: coenzyme F420-0:L-glutamate ligase [bacterium]|nr:coenzyme F420-0:L-glutamate ligase [bacterium]